MFERLRGIVANEIVLMLSINYTFELEEPFRLNMGEIDQHGNVLMMMMQSIMEVLDEKISFEHFA
jgi:hypothetical protein